MAAMGKPNWRDHSDSGIALRQIRGVPREPSDDPRTVRFRNFETYGCPEAVVATGKVFYEVELAVVGGNPQLGWASAGFDLTINTRSHNGVGDDPDSWGVDGARRTRRGSAPLP